MWNEFKKFAMRGSVVDLAIGVVIGGAFGKIVTSLVDDVITPFIGLLIGRIKFDNLFVSLHGHYATLDAAKAAGAPTVNYGIFIQNVVDFLLVAFVIFLVIRSINRFRERAQRKPLPPEPTEKDCPFCIMRIPIRARRCPHCTTELTA